MKQYLLSFLILAATVAKAQTQADSMKAPEGNKALDSRYGFLGNKFDTPFTSYKGLVLVEDKQGFKIYKRVVDIKVFGKAKIKTIHYKFYKGQLAAVQVFAPNSLVNEDSWRELLRAAYGPAQDSIETKEADDDDYHNYGGNYFWNGMKAGINLAIYLGRDISVNVQSFIVTDRKERDDAAALKRAAQKL